MKKLLTLLLTCSFAAAFGAASDTFESSLTLYRQADDQPAEQNTSTSSMRAITLQCVDGSIDIEKSLYKHSELFTNIVSDFSETQKIALPLGDYNAREVNTLKTALTLRTEARSTSIFLSNLSYMFRGLEPARLRRFFELADYVMLDDEICIQTFAQLCAPAYAQQHINADDFSDDYAPNVAWDLKKAIFPFIAQSIYKQFDKDISCIPQDSPYKSLLIGIPKKLNDALTTRIGQTRKIPQFGAILHFGALMNVIAFSPDSSLFASKAYDDNTITLFDTGSGEKVQTLRGHTSSVNAIAFSPDGNLLASASCDRTVRFWDSHSGQSIKTLYGHKKWVEAVAFNPNGNLIASADAEIIHLWDVHTGEPAKTFQCHTPIGSIAFSPDGSLLASTSFGNTVCLWDVSTGKLIKTLQGHTKPIHSIAFSPDRDILASASWDRTTRLWNVNTGESIKTLQGHTNLVNSVAFNPDGTILASASFDNTVRIWDVSTGECKETIEHTGPEAIAFSPDGNMFAFEDRKDKSICLRYDYIQALCSITNWQEKEFLLNAAQDWHSGNTYLVKPEYRSAYESLINRFTFLNDARLFSHVIDAA